MEILTYRNIDFKIDHKDYKRFLDNDSQSVNCWYGISLQVDGRFKDARKYLILNKVFSHLKDDIDLNLDWYVLHEY